MRENVVSKQNMMGHRKSHCDNVEKTTFQNARQTVLESSNAIVERIFEKKISAEAY